MTYFWFTKRNGWSTYSVLSAWRTFLPIKCSIPANNHMNETLKIVARCATIATTSPAVTTYLLYVNNSQNQSVKRRGGIFIWSNKVVSHFNDGANKIDNTNNDQIRMTWLDYVSSVFTSFEQRPCSKINTKKSIE